MLNEAKKAIVDGKYSDAKAKYNRLRDINICDATRKETDVKKGLDELRTLEGKQGISVEFVAGAGANKPLYKVNSDSRPMNYGVTFGAGFQFAYVNPASLADNGSGPANREVDARFRKATFRVGVKLL